jgi:tetratricopeptide (TPR) repeat protein
VVKMNRSKTTDRGLDGADAARDVRGKADRRLGVFSVLGLAVLVAIPWMPSLRNWLFPRQGIASLVIASRRLPYRTVDGRLSGGFGYQPISPVLRGAQSTRAVAFGLAAAAAAIQAKQTDLHASGVAALLTGAYDPAVAALEQADLSHSDASVLSDLSAAYYARAVARDYAPDYLAALDVAERAWLLHRTPESAWNRAIAASGLQLGKASDDAWEAFLRISGESDWKAEAIERRARLNRVTDLDTWKTLEPQLWSWIVANREQAIDDAVRRFPAHAGRYFEEGLLKQWAAARLGGQDTKPLVRLATVMAGSLALQREELPTDAVSAIARACASETGCDDMARAYVSLQQGRKAMVDGDYAAAVPRLESAASSMTLLGSPLQWTARYHLASCRVYQNEFEQGRNEALALLAGLEHRRYRELNGRVLWLLGLCDLHAARPEEGLQHYRDAQQLFAAGRDRASVAVIHGLIADALEFVGSTDEASEHRLQVFAGMRASGDWRRYAVMTFEAGCGAFAGRRLAASDFLLAETVRTALHDRQYALAAMATLWRARIASREGDLKEANRRARDARAYWDAIVDRDQQDLVAANVGGAFRGSIAALETSDRDLTKTIEFFEKAGNRAWIPQLLYQRARSYEKSGDRRSAERDLRRAVDLAEDVLDGDAPPDMQDGFASDVRATYSALIALLLREKREDEALSYAERSRLAGTGLRGERSIVALASAIPADVCMVMYEWAADDSLFVWTVADGGSHGIRLPVSSRLRPLISRVKAGDLTGSNLDELYDDLVRPWIATIPAGSTLIVLPTAELQPVPFSALRNRMTHRSLIEDYAVAAAPSMTSFLRSADRLLRRRPDKVLVVADPAYHEFKRLLHSKDEAIRIARQYDDVITLTGDAATVDGLLKSVPGASILHFAGHAVANDLLPTRSALILTGDGTRDARLSVKELFARRLPLRVVVLSACSTAAAASARSSMTLARAFLEGGSAAVVGTLWPVGDETSAAFSHRFHRALASGQSPASAVRIAQLEMKGDSPVDDWAAFYVMEGSIPKKERGPDA